MLSMYTDDEEVEFQVWTAYYDHDDMRWNFGWRIIHDDIVAATNLTTDNITIPGDSHHPAPVVRALSDLLTFFSAFAEAVTTGGPDSENIDLFPATLVPTAECYGEEASVLAEVLGR